MSIQSDVFVEHEGTIDSLTPRTRGTLRRTSPFTTGLQVCGFYSFLCGTSRIYFLFGTQGMFSRHPKDPPRGGLGALGTLRIRLVEDWVLRGAGSRMTPAPLYQTACGGSSLSACARRYLIFTFTFYICFLSSWNIFSHLFSPKVHWLLITMIYDHVEALAC